LDGIVIHLGGRHFKNIRTAGLEVRAGAGASLGSLINLACEKGLKGIEGLVGIPATLGGAISMNACYSGNISDRLESVRVMDVRTGKISVLKKKNIKFSYRHSGFEGYIILEACFKLEKGDKDALLKRKKELIDIKRKKQPLEAMSAGCVFKNPEGGIAAARYIDMIGLKGRRIGGAEISKKHANFIVNRKKATAKDVLGLMDLAKKRVKSHFNIDLEPEVIIA
jgi:UDP-N-acetylmuramate dehydrogenase